jgi:hypothetical protein
MCHKHRCLMLRAQFLMIAQLLLLWSDSILASVICVQQLPPCDFLISQSYSIPHSRNLFSTPNDLVPVSQRQHIISLKHLNSVLPTHKTCTLRFSLFIILMPALALDSKSSSYPSFTDPSIHLMSEFHPPSPQ